MCSKLPSDQLRKFEGNGIAFLKVISKELEVQILWDTVYTGYAHQYSFRIFDTSKITLSVKTSITEITKGLNIFRNSVPTTNVYIYTPLTPLLIQQFDLQKEGQWHGQLVWKSTFQFCCTVYFKMFRYTFNRFGVSILKSFNCRSTSKFTRQTSWSI